MERILVAWIGRTDLRAVEEHDAIGLGPIARAVSERAFSAVHLLSNYPRQTPFDIYRP